MSPTRNGLRNQLQLCEEHNISFLTNPDPSKSKSKCIYFTCGHYRKPVKVVFNHQKLPWVSQVDYLGHIIHESGSQDVDCRKARGSYIGSSTELLGIFRFYSPLQKSSAKHTYCCSLWKKYMEPFQRVCLSNLPISIGTPICSPFKNSILRVFWSSLNTILYG